MRSHFQSGCGGPEETALPCAAPLGTDGLGNRYFRLGAEAGACTRQVSAVGYGC